MPGTAKRKCEPSSSVNSGVHEQKAAVNAIQPLGGISTLQLQFFLAASWMLLVKIMTGVA